MATGNYFSQNTADDPKYQGIKAFRAAGPGKMETLPLYRGNFNKGAVMEMADAVGTAQKLGVPTLSAEELVNKMLVEGREDAGTNAFNYNDKASSAVFNNLIDNYGITPIGATLVAAVLDKAKVSKRLGISFEEAWNGTGTSAAGRTGAQHSARAAQSKHAATDPKNAELLSLVKTVMQDGISPADRLLMTYKRGISPKMLTGGMESTEIVDKLVGDKTIPRDLFKLINDQSARVLGTQLANNFVAKATNTQPASTAQFVSGFKNPTYVNGPTVQTEMQLFLEHPAVRASLKAMGATPDAPGF